MMNDDYNGIIMVIHNNTKENIKMNGGTISLGLFHTKKKCRPKGCLNAVFHSHYYFILIFFYLSFVWNLL